MTPGYAFALQTLDRAGERRVDEAWLDAARSDPTARMLVLRDDGAVLCRDGAPLPLPLDALDAD